MTIAPLDRFITTGRNPDEPKDKQPLSSLKNEQFIVLLGAPGMGKSEALKQLASLEGEVSHPAYAVVDQPISPGSTVYIDALDEIPVEEARGIARALQRTPDVRWRVSCRAESWHDGGRLSLAYGDKGASRGMNPVVAQLLPLEEDESMQVLQVLGCDEPRKFLSSLEAIRSTAFAMTPLGLKFLTKTNLDSLVDLTRFKLYQNGVEHLAFEHNDTKQEDAHRGALTLESRLDIAGRVSLTLLLSGKHRVKPSALGHGSAITSDDLQLERVKLGVVLDTALFIKNGDVFEPLHRSIQEFLAGRFLARLVTDGLGNPKLHPERALALIVSPDGLAADAVRPLYAWYAGHLVSQGALDEAKRLVQRDPETLLLHGDTAQLPVGSRLIVLREVGARDPFFRWAPQRWSPAEITTVGLITPDIVDQALQMLSLETSGYRVNMLLEALSVGRPHAVAADACWGMVLSQAGVEWCRRVAVSAWLHCAGPSVEEIWSRIERLSGAVEHEAGNLRSMAQLFCAIPPSQLVGADINRLLETMKPVYEALSQWPKSNTPSTGSLTYAVRDVAWHASENLWPALIMDDPKRWHPKAGKGSTEHAFASVFGIAVLSKFDITPRELACLLVATGVIVGNDSVFKRAAQEWIAKHEDLDILIADIVDLTDQDVADCGSIAIGMRALGIAPNEQRVRLVVNSRELLARVGGVYVGRQVSNWVLQQGDRAPDWLIQLLRDDLDPEVVSTVTACLKMHEAEVKTLEAHASGSVENVLLLFIKECQTAQALTDQQLQTLMYWGAEIYCGNYPLALNKRSGIPAINEALGEALAGVAIDGLVSGGHLPRTVCYAASASLRLDRGLDLAELPISEVITALRSSNNLRDPHLRDRLEIRCASELERAFPTARDSFEQLMHSDDGSWSDLLQILAERRIDGDLQSWAVRAQLQHPNQLKGIRLQSVLRLARANIHDEELIQITHEYLEDFNGRSGPQGQTSLPWNFIEDRLRWAFFGVCVHPMTFSDAFTEALEASDDQAIHRLVVDDYPQRGFFADPATTVTVSKLLIEFFIRRSPAIEGHYDRMWVDTTKVIKSLRLANDSGVECTFISLIAAAQGTAWELVLKHDLEVYRRDARSQARPLIEPVDLAKVIQNKGPINVQNLRALTLMVLREIAEEVQSSPLNLWSLYWNAGRPKIENDCRDVLADKLRDRLRFYGNFDVYPEAASSGGTRADMMVTDGTLYLPLEAKHTYHSHLWYGHSGQLQTYARAPNTEGQGIYVVFWFGGVHKIQPSPEGVKHQTPEALKIALEAQLPADLRGKTSVVVLDLTDAGTAAKARKESGYEQGKAEKRERRATAKEKKIGK
ncbi:hypothetical protein KH389_12930 [Pseudomonas qingdaonensis]|uniref:ATP-binding protein n=1 Tax=Pseudomonas qingdaonensis TaxID=2056231 RepID=A0ABX8DYN0_9PSED|nr:hypothetical protein [Pseudomonas qingdaonensis]QVL21425.1 hypothetical protein KH389_12930 [Pseudomonas qingdaonensis]